MRMKALIAAAAMIAALAGATRPAVAYWWPWYSYYGYDYSVRLLRLALGRSDVFLCPAKARICRAGMRHATGLGCRALAVGLFLTKRII